MHLLLGKLCLAPAEKGDNISAMSDGFQTPQRDHARCGSGVGWCPIHRARLLLHNPEAAIFQASALIKIVGGVVGVAGAHVPSREFGFVPAQ